MEHDSGTSVDFARRLYDSVLGWYVNADSKAQVILALDGAFLTFLSGVIFSKPDDLSKLILRITPWTWSVLALMTCCLFASIGSALHCLWSRIYTPAELAALIRSSDQADRYGPRIMWFFQFVGALDPARFLSTLRHVDGDFEVEVLAAQAFILSQNVQKKHRSVNRGFVLAAATVVLLFIAGLSYMVGVKLRPV